MRGERREDLTGTIVVRVYTAEVPENKAIGGTFSREPEESRTKI